MSDDYGNLVSAAAEYGPALYSGYSAYKRNESFIRGAGQATQGAMLGTDVAGFVTGSGRGLGAIAARTAAGTALKGAILRTAGQTAAKVGLTAAATSAAASGGAAAAGAAAGVASGAAAGAAAGSWAPGIGTAIGAAVGAVAPLIIPHIPVVGDVVNKVPLVGGILSPKGKKGKTVVGARGDTTTSSSNFLAQSSGEHTVTGAQSVKQNRAEYESGRGFRR